MRGDQGAASPRARCVSCGRPIKPGELAVRDIGRRGIDIYHQRCSPTLNVPSPMRWEPPRRGLRPALAAACAVVAGWLFHRRTRR